MEIKKLSDCVMHDIVKAWNLGFNGYAVQLEMTQEIFFERLVMEGISMEHSLVGFVDGEPMGIILNGIRNVEGRKTAWNGGTCVAPAYRGKGYTQQLMDEVMHIYEQESVQDASLEAIIENKIAIQLYRNYGYEVVDELVFLSGNAHLDETLSFRTYHPDQLPSLYFYEEPGAWQCQSKSIRNAECFVFEEDNEPIGYAVFKRVWNEEGNLVRVILYQLKVLSQEYMNKISKMLATIAEIAVPFLMVNLSKKSGEVQFLIENDYELTTEQVLMKKT